MMINVLSIDDSHTLHYVTLLSYCCIFVETPKEDEPTKFLCSRWPTLPTVPSICIRVLTIVTGEQIVSAKQEKILQDIYSHNIYCNYIDTYLHIYIYIFPINQIPSKDNNILSHSKAFQSFPQPSFVIKRVKECKVSGYIRLPKTKSVL